MASDTPYIEMDYLDKRIEVAINSANLLTESGVFPDCCYQISEALSRVLNELGVQAHSMACDVYGWNHDFLRWRRNEHFEIDRHNKRLVKKKDWRDKKRPQRKSRGKPRLKRQIDPYNLSLFHEQQVEGGGYDGHVICIADGWVLDATAGQFHRPHKNLESSRIITIPLESFGQMPDDFIKGWSEKNFMAMTSFAQNLVAITQPSKKSGQLSYFLRPDIEPDNWLNHTETAKSNIEMATRFILEISQRTLAGETEFDLGDLIARLSNEIQ